ncbi:MAG: zinc ribbon domain-containing protein [Phycisphaerales bacterium]|nr:zinc ribbon domain-containing protein [Phycisphaerales bacterium]
MPLYEYRCADDGTTLTLLRTMAQADDPVTDPDGLDRTFERVQSVFQVDATAPRHTSSPPAGGCGHGCACHPG